MKPGGFEKESSSAHSTIFALNGHNPAAMSNRSVMQIKRAWALQSFVLCFLLNAVLTVFLFIMADRVMQGLTEWVSPLRGPGAPILSDDARAALDGLRILIDQTHQYLARFLFVLSGVVTLLLWLLIYLLGSRQIDRASAIVPTE